MSERQLAFSLKHVVPSHLYLSNHPVKSSSIIAKAQDSVITHSECPGPWKQGGTSLELSQAVCGIQSKARRAKEEWQMQDPMGPRRQCEIPPAGWGREDSKALWT